MGIIPLLIFPDDSIKNDANSMRPIKYHPIWHLNSQENTKSEDIDLIYRGKIYSGRKYKVFLNINKKKVKIKEKSVDEIILIIVYLENLNLFGKNYLNIVSEIIMKNFENIFQKIMISEILKLNLIKNSKSEKIISEGDFEKKKIMTLLNDILEDYLSLIYFSQKKHSLYLNIEKRDL
ncbi:MAG: hypothetical protein ACXAEX_09810 [Promethearchaeota archaeon]